MSGDSGNLSIDFLVGFTIFLIAFIWVVSMIPGLMIGLQSYTIDSDAVAYRTGVILAEDPGEPAFPLFPWETRLCDVPPDYCKRNVVRFGLAVSKNTPNILSRNKVDTFFCSSVFSYPDDYQQRVIFGDYPYRFNISLMEVGSTQPPKSVGDSMSGNFGSIRRLVKIKESSYATINASYDNTTHPDYFSGDNETVHEFSILIDNTELLKDKVRDPVYQIDPARERITINITHLNETMAGPYANRNSCFNINLTHIYAKDPALVRIQLFTAPVLDGVQYKDINTEAIYATLPSVKNNISLKLDPSFIPWSNYPRIYLTLRFNLVQNASAPAALNCSAYNGSRFLNNSLSSAFDYNYDPKNVTQSELTDGVLEVSTGSGYRTVTGPAPVNLSANFKYEILSGTPNFNVKFTDLSTGSPVEWAWNFTNGGVTIDSPLNNPTHNYGAQGIYTVKLTVKDTAGASASITKTVDLSAPIASFTRNPLTGNAPLAVTFTDTSTGGAPSAWDWNFGDGSPHSAVQNPSYIYTVVGNYTAQLTVSNIFGSSSATKQVNVTYPAPTFTSISPTSGPTSGGTAVTIVGTNFVSGGSFGVTIGGVAATSVVRINATYITAVTPAGAPGAQNVVITNNDGQTATGPGAYTYVAPPTFVSAATNTTGTVITITFNKAMANPTGKQAQFTYKINGGVAQLFSAAALNAVTTNIDLTTSGTAIKNGDVVTVSYTAGTVLAADNGVLATFTNQPVTNNMPAPTYTIVIRATVGTTSWTAPTGVTSVEYLVVAGGGGGGNSPDRTGGGGGAGGVLSSTTYPVTAGNSYTVIVGAGGNANTQGSDSTFATITAKGGGRGGQLNSVSTTGGSGGGAYHNSADSGKAGTAGQGSAGGNGYDSGSQKFGAGGGGGQSAVGAAGTTNGGGNGGNGYTSTISGSSVVYAGGGGGGWQNLGGASGTGGSGGTGGGGAGGDTGTAGTAGTAGTGGGGGGGSSANNSAGAAGGAGGSGIVIIKYLN